LRERIASHQIPPGTKLVEERLAVEFGITRARMREVFSALEALGLVMRIPNRGTVVCKLDLNQVFEIYDVREALEGMCARLAAQNAPPESWQDMVDLYAPDGAMEQYVKEGNIEDFFEEYSRLRLRMIEAANNPVLASMLDGILEKSKVIMRRVMILPGRTAQALIEHRAIIAALRSGDAESAEALRRQNIRSAVAHLKRYKTWVL
jgi:DNA-binding GntR family transcriptional regulator